MVLGYEGTIGDQGFVYLCSILLSFFSVWFDKFFADMSRSLGKI